MPNAITVRINGQSVGQTDLVNSYQATGKTYGLANV